MIVDEAILLLSEGDDQLTMANLARSLSSGVMSLYRYFRNRDELLDAVGEHLLSLWKPPAVEGRPWQNVVYDWLCETQRLWDEYPNALRIVFWNTSRSSLWAAIWAVPLVELFQREGMTNDKIAFATHWLGTSAVSCIIMENQHPGKNIGFPQFSINPNVQIDVDYFSMILTSAEKIGRDEVRDFSFRNIIRGLESLISAK